MAILMDLVLKTSILIAAGAAITWLMRRGSAASRHAVWTAVCAAAVLLPCGRLILPAMPIFVLAEDARPPAAAVASGLAATAIAPAVRATALVTPVPASGPAVAFEIPAGQPSRDRAQISPDQADASAAWTLSSLLAGVWLTGVGVMLLKAAVGAFGVRRLARDAHSATDPATLDRLGMTIRRFNVRRQVRLLIATGDCTPATWGIVWPLILLPSSVATWRDDRLDRLDLVLTHEVAHIARWDALAQIVARGAVAMHWFNPLVWLVAQRARLERERACDDAVLARGFRASEYASELLALTESLSSPVRATSGVLAMARRSQLDRRIRAILDDGLSRRGTSRWSRVFAAVLIVIALPASAARLAARPQAAAEEVLVEPSGPVVEVVRPTVTQAAVIRTSAPQPARPAMSQESAAPTQTPAGAAASSQDAKWREARNAMLGQLLERARKHERDARIKIEIGTAAPVDVAGLERMVTTIERAITPTGHTSPWQWVLGDKEVAAARARFAAALKELDAAETRFDNGLLSTTDLNSVTLAALVAVVGEVAAAQAAAPAEQVRFVTRSGTNTLEPARSMFMTRDGDSAQALYALLTGRMSVVMDVMGPAGVDMLLVTILKAAATLPDDTQRANLLLDLGQGYTLTPEMVSLYVAAASGIQSATERARVFAQPIRVKPGGGD